MKRIERGTIFIITSSQQFDESRPEYAEELYDRMTENQTSEPPDLESMFAQRSPSPLKIIELGSEPHNALRKANKELGLAMDDSEIEYLAQAYAANGLNRSPTDVELFMFAQ